MSPEWVFIYFCGIYAHVKSQFIFVVCISIRVAAMI
jgi:hypothetical protein